MTEPTFQFCNRSFPQRFFNFQAVHGNELKSGDGDLEVLAGVPFSSTC